MRGRPPRLVAAGLVSHALNPGNIRPAVLSDDADRATSSKPLSQTKQRYPFQLSGYGLLSNLFHRLLQAEPGPHRPIRIVEYPFPW